MNQARKTFISDTNPISVLQSIGAIQGVVEQEQNSTPKQTSSQSVDKFRVQLYRGDNHGQDNADVDVMQNALESALQVQQLASKLRANEQALIEREKELDGRIETWNETVRQQQDEIEARISQLEQNASQVRCQQLHLMQLQTDIVKSYEATRSVVESLVSETGSDARTIATLEKLKYEVKGRFDYIYRRWSHLSNLMQQGRDDDTAERGVDDSVDWTV